jgi:hypothetical protein
MINYHNLLNFTILHLFNQIFIFPQSYEMRTGLLYFSFITLIHSNFCIDNPI